MKDLIICWNEDEGFYCEDFKDEMFFVVLVKLIEKYELKSSPTTYSEMGMYFDIRQQNRDKFNIELREEDGSDWIFG